MSEAFIIVAWVAGLAIMVSILGGMVALGIALHEAGRQRRRVRNLQGLRNNDQ